MKIKCPDCNKMISKTIGRHEYTESGLKNVYLENITIYKCDCGVSIPSIFHAERLDNLIAKKLLSKPALLDGLEITFLRKNIPLSSNIFSKKIGVDKTTFSKWENDHQVQSQANDRHIRTMYMLQKGISRVDSLEISELLTNLKLVKQPYDFVFVAEKVGDDYVVSMKVVTGATVDNIYSVEVCYGECVLATSGHSWNIAGNHMVDTSISSRSYGRSVVGTNPYYGFIANSELEKWRRDNQNSFIQ